MHYHLKNLEIEASIGVYESEKISQICQAEHYQLLEKLHAVLSEGISEKFSRLENVKISIEKFPFKNGSIVIF